MATFNKKGYHIRTDLVHMANAIHEMNPDNSRRMNEIARNLDNYEYFKVKINGVTYIHWRDHDKLFGTSTINTKK